MFAVCVGAAQVFCWLEYNQLVAIITQDPTAPQKAAALFGNTAVHASFGDVELAQMTLRAAIGEGLDFELALTDPELPGTVIRVRSEGLHMNYYERLFKVFEHPAPR